MRRENLDKALTGLDGENSMFPVAMDGPEASVPLANTRDDEELVASAHFEYACGVS